MKKNVALVLSAGGARGFAHIGVIEELEKRGYQITSVAGTSMGALVAGIYSTGKISEFKQWALQLNKSEVYRLMDFTMNLGFVKMDRVFDELRLLVGKWEIAELNISTKIIAADVTSKKEVVFDKGSLFNAIRASVAYPTVITPLEIDGKLLVDGGIVNPMPVNRVERTGGDILVAVDLSADFDYIVDSKFVKQSEESKNMSFSIIRGIINKWRDDSDSEVNDRAHWSYLKLIDESLNMMHRRIIELSLEVTPADILVSISHECGGLFDYYRAEELIEYGRAQAIKSIDKWEEKSVSGK